MIAKKSFGQHFLKNQGVVKQIIAAAEIKPGEVVLEVGPGRGVLTEALVETGAHVIAVEADRDLIPLLADRFGSKITLIEGDILTFDAGRLGDRPFKLVANLPYNIASAVIEKFFVAAARPTRMVVMVQKEVADRMLAKPGEMSVLTVACQLYAHLKRVVNVSPGSFNPPPKVDSTVVRLDIKNDLDANEQIIALAKAGFHSRRKQLHRNLADQKIASSEVIKSLLADLGLPPTARAQELRIEQWVELHRRLALHL